MVNSRRVMGRRMRALKSDPKMASVADAQAQKATDYILDNRATGTTLVARCETLRRSIVLSCNGTISAHLRGLFEVYDDDGIAYRWAGGGTIVADTRIITQDDQRINGRYASLAVRIAPRYY